MNLLLLAANFTSPYRVLRCAAAGGNRVVVAGGTARARSLVLSRFCDGYEDFAFDRSGPDAAQALDALARARNIDLILPSDIETTRFLCAVAPMMKTPVFPVPSLDAFESLATKDRFRLLCRDMGLPHPSGRLFETRDDLARAVEQGELRFPAMFKPVDMAGSLGVTKVEAADAARAAADIDYAPVLVQDFVDGTDIGISMVCEAGRIGRQTVFTRGSTYRFTENTELARLTAQIVEALKLTGVFNFDARVDTSGKVWLIECNPRFFFSIDVVMWAGDNFTVPGMPSDGVRAIAPGTVRLLPDVVKDMLRFRFPDALGRRVLAHWLSDPLMMALLMTGYSNRWTARWLEWVLTKKKKGPEATSGPILSDDRRGYLRA